jgi:hypothetical protein
MMTKQIFETVADSIKGMRSETGAYDEETLDHMSMMMADIFEESNQNFDRDLFLDACGCEVEAGFTEIDMAETIQYALRDRLDENAMGEPKISIFEQSTVQVSYADGMEFQIDVRQVDPDEQKFFGEDQ